MSKRKYVHIQEQLPVIQKMLASGMTQKEVEADSAEVDMTGKRKYEMHIYSAVTETRNKNYNRFRRHTNPEQIELLKQKRNDCSTVLKELRKDIETSEGIVERNPKMKEEIA